MKRCKYKRIKSNGRRKLNLFSFFIRKNCHFGKFRHVSEEILSRVRGNSIRCQKGICQVSDSGRTGVRKNRFVFPFWGRIKKNTRPHVPLRFDLYPTEFSTDISFFSDLCLYLQRNNKTYYDYETYRRNNKMDKGNPPLGKNPVVRNLVYDSLYGLQRTGRFDGRG